ncbi:MAG: DUF5682 family protein [Planctomycetota bacterium]|nr:DUF5682 family protein [Planctomycetota bacterium]
MPTPHLNILGIRHHGRGSARLVQRALEDLKPDAVLIEGPADAASVLELAADPAMKPPVALLVYEPQEPSNASFYPFATFSPEWQAMRYAQQQSILLRFIDLPRSLRWPGAGEQERKALDAEAGNGPASAAEGSPVAADQPRRRTDPLEALARAAGFADGEAWWGRLIEEHRDAGGGASGTGGGERPMVLFDAIREAMGAVRARTLGEGTAPTLLEAESLVREGHMRRCIRVAQKEGHENIAVICGAWHAPVLTTQALKDHPAKADDALLKTLEKRKTAATWIPWTFERLAADSGYGAGITSPGWYEHLWLHQSNLAEQWLARVARLMRDEDLDASPASIVEAVRLAQALASLRGITTPGLEELTQATLSIFCHGNPLPLRVIERKLIVGDRLGEVPEACPTVPLQQDLAAQQKSLKLKVSADSAPLDLDQRKPTDLARSRLLHRLNLLEIYWGKLENDQRQRTSTFHEIWVLQWAPELSVAVMVAARWGNTVEQAASAKSQQRAMAVTSLPQVSQMLSDLLLAELPQAVTVVVARIQELAAVATDVAHLMEALPPLASVLRYGDVRHTASGLIEPIVTGLVARICAGLLPAMASLDDDAAAAMRDRIDAVQSALKLLDRASLRDQWHDTLRKVGDATVHGLVVGRTWRILLDAGVAAADETAAKLSFALSPGNDPQHASAWLEGFLADSGLVLVHDPHMLGVIDQWVTGLPRDVFEQICPIARRTFATFERPLRRQIGERLRSMSASGSQGAGQSRQNGAAARPYQAARGQLVAPILAMLLGEAAS